MRTTYHPKTLKFFVLTSILSISIVLLGGTLLTATSLYENMITEQAQKTSRGISQQIYSSILHAMRLGANGTEIQELITETQKAHKDTPYQIRTYGSPLLTTKNEQAALLTPPKEIRRALLEGKMATYNQGGITRNIYPLQAEATCQGCHAGIKAGDVMGVVEIEQNVQKIAAEMRTSNMGLFIGYGLLVALAAIGLTAYVVKRIDRTVSLFQNKTASINSVADLNQLNFTNIDFGFQELNSAFRHVETMVQRFREIAVDKKILSLKIEMSNRLIITSDMINNWHKFIKELLVDIDRIVPTHAIIAVCQDDEDHCHSEIFWRRNHSEATRTLMESLFSKKLSEQNVVDCSALPDITHHITDRNSLLPELQDHDIAIHTKTLYLELPKMRGVIGIAVPAEGADEPIRRIVTESILTTLLNLIGSVHAISRYTKDLEYYATRDPLTNLHNQRMFWELLNYEVGRAIRHEYKFAVMILDMDNFKLINDLHGHAFGDTCLKAFAAILAEHSREGDFVVRYGGDEFAIILPETSQEQAYQVAKRISTMINKMSLVAPDKSTVQATSSIGLAIFPNHAQTANDLFQVADNMMYKAKKSGKNAIALPSENEIGEVVHQHDHKKRMIMKAIEEDRIVPYFQPIVKYGSHAYPINELLMRIVDGNDVIPAGEFIELAENMGILHKMDYILIEKAFAMAKEINYQGYLFINISPRVFINDKFFSWLRHQTKANGLQPEQIVLEITERETVKNIDLIESILHTLNRDGYKFAIDDFGSGFSSYQYLKRFPVDFIKIEGEFIRNLPKDREYRAFVKSIVTLAKELKVRTIAEFIENEEIYAALEEFGIDYGQGYHLGRPQPHLRPLLDKKTNPIPSLEIHRQHQTDIQQIYA